MPEIKMEANRVNGNVNGSGRGSPRVKVEIKSETPTKGRDDFWDSLRSEEASSSRSPTPPISRTRSISVKEEAYPAVNSASRPGSSTPRGGRQAIKKEPVQRSLIDDLPVAWDEAHETFVALERCVYETKKLGLSREQDEMMVCDCVYDKRNPSAPQCGPHSDCVNRAIFIECLAKECRARSQCQNQRFTNRQFANVEIVLTEKKGYGLRASTDIPSGTLIYEYIGEVVAEQTFRKRMAQYADEGIKHFYFMMLQKEEYIDATKKGGIGRFANHSCDPNCEVQKWVVGRRLRMGIFSKRDIQRGEEVTFNYNVDRYGHDAQTCYCGEPNCVGTIGGKTQTDIGGLDDLFIDALGISEQVEAEGMKGNKKKKSRQLGEDFIPILQPITEVETQKVAAAIRQSMDKIRMMTFLLQRVQMTSDHIVHRDLIRMHGFSLMSMILSDLADEREIALLALQSMLLWKMQYRNKIADSHVEEPVKSLAEEGDAQVRSLAQELLTYWSQLEMDYKIPRRTKIDSLDAEDNAQTHTLTEAPAFTYEHRRPHAWENTQTIEIKVAPVIYRAPSAFFRPAPPPPLPSPKPQIAQSAMNRSKLDAIIASAQQNLPAASSTPGSQSPADSLRSRSSMDDGSRKRVKFSQALESNGSTVEPSDYERNIAEEEAMKKEKRLMKLVGEHVVRSMNKYKEMMDHETFKKYAKECTQVLVDKEKRSHTYASTRHPTLTDEKKAKIKAFTKEFTHKVLKRLKDKGKLRKPRPAGAPNGNGNGNVNGARPKSSSETIETPMTESADADHGNMENDLNDIFGRDEDSGSSGRAKGNGVGGRGGDESPSKMLRVDTWSAPPRASVLLPDDTPSRTPGSL